MNIDQGTILTAVFFLLLFSIPFIILNISHRKKVKRNLGLLHAEATKSNLKITRSNSWINTSIGMDENAQVVIFTKKTIDGNTTRQVALADIEKCRIQNIKRTSYNGSEHYSITERLELVFEPRDKSKPDMPFPFYDIQHDGGMLTGELQHVEKWCGMINDKIKYPERKK